MKRLLRMFIPWLIALAFIFIVAANPLQEIQVPAWRDVLKAVILLLIAAAGSPVTQLIKNALKIEQRQALLLTAVMAGLVAALEMWLSGLLKFSDITLGNFPQTFFAVFSVATLYYQWLKGSEGVLGKKLLLKEPT